MQITSLPSFHAPVQYGAPTSVVSTAASLDSFAPGPYQDHSFLSRAGGATIGGIAGIGIGRFVGGAFGPMGSAVGAIAGGIYGAGTGWDYGFATTAFTYMGASAGATIGGAAGGPMGALVGGAVGGYLGYKLAN